MRACFLEAMIDVFLAYLFTVSLIIKSLHAADCPAYSGGGNISVYWGQGSSAEEGTLTEACDTGLYSIVMLAYLHYGSQPSLNLGNHCSSEDCTKLQPQIKHCQSKGIQVLLSMEIDLTELNSTSTASYLWDNFLSGNEGPLGSVALDGIDLPNFGYNTSIHWDELVRAINESTQERKIYLSIAPRCSHDPGSDSAIATGLFDYIWVEYYNNYAPCEYLNDGPEELLNSWKDWTSSVLSNNSVFLGLAASGESSATSSGYIPPDKLKSDILPTIKDASNYGGVMIWNRYYDKKNNYTGQIKDGIHPKVCECICHDAVSSSFYGLFQSV